MASNIDADVTAPLRRPGECRPDSLTTSTRVLISLVVIFGILSLAVSGALLQRVIVLQQLIDDDVTNNDVSVQDKGGRAKQHDAVYLYPEYFATTKQHFAYLKAVANATQGTRSHRHTFPARKGCGYTCRNRTYPYDCPTYDIGPKPELKSRQRRTVEGYNAVHHSCCTSYRRYIDPDTAMNIVGEMRDLVQLAEERQYLLTEECIQNKGCSGCECQQPEPFFHQAVVYTKKQTSYSSFEIDTIQVAGCCKCVNVDRGRR